MPQAAAQTADSAPPDITAAQGAPDIMAGQSSAQLDDILKRRKRVEAEEAAEAKTGDKLLADQQQQIADFVKANPYPIAKVEPWKEKPPEPDPLTGFGSWASALGILASLRTHQPLTNSLNAAAAGMQAVRAGDLQRYNAAHEAWKDNTDLAIKQADWEGKAYENALGLMEKDQALGFARWKAIAAETENRGAMLLGDAGVVEHMQEYALALKNQALTGAERMNALSDHAEMMKRFLEDQQEFVEKNKRQPTAQEKEAMWARASTPYLATAKPETGGGETMSKQEAKAVEDLMKANPNMTRTEAIKKVSEAAKTNIYSRSGPAMIMRKYLDAHPDATAEELATENARIGSQAQAARAFASGKQGDTIRSMNVAVNHLDTLNELSTALENGDVQLLNRAKNEFQAQMGEPAPTNFSAAKIVIGNEIIKAVIGAAGALGDREEAQKNIDAANSPAQLKSVVNTYQRLMAGQLNGLRRQYEQATKQDDFDDLLSDRTKEVMRKHGYEEGGPDTTSTSDFVEGQPYTDSNGNKAVYRGGKWVEVP